MAGSSPTLDDKYDLTKDRVFISGPQVMVRATLVQKALDAEAGLNTAGYITGYRGSPVGGVDQAFMRAKALLEPQKHQVPSRPQRGSCRDRAVGLPAGGDAGRGRL